MTHRVSWGFKSVASACLLAACGGTQAPPPSPLTSRSGLPCDSVVVLAKTTADSLRALPPEPTSAFAFSPPIELRGKHGVMTVRVSESGHAELAGIAMADGVVVPRSFVDELTDKIKASHFRPAHLDGCDVPYSFKITLRF